MTEPKLQIQIMCQGEQRRLAHLGHPKHLLKVNGETILGRTLRLLRELGAPHPVIVGPSELADEAKADAAARGLFVDVFDTTTGKMASQPYTNHCWASRPGICILDGLAQAATSLGRSDRRTLTLMGDVIFTRATLAAILGDERPLVFSGTTVLTSSQGELFSVAWDDREDMKRMLESAPCRVDRTGRALVFRQQQGGHLRRLLWWAMERRRLRPPPNPPNRIWHPDLYLEVTDWTADIDDDADVARLPELGDRCAYEAANAADFRTATAG